MYHLHSAPLLQKRDANGRSMDRYFAEISPKLHQVLFSFFCLVLLWLLVINYLSIGTIRQGKLSHQIPLAHFVSGYCSCDYSWLCCWCLSLHWVNYFLLWLQLLLLPPLSGEPKVNSYTQADYHIHLLRHAVSTHEPLFVYLISEMFHVELLRRIFMPPKSNIFPDPN